MTPWQSVGKVPNQEATPRRTVRIPDELWEAVKRKAVDEGKTVTEVIVQALTRYVREYDS